MRKTIFDTLLNSLLPRRLFLVVTLNFSIYSYAVYILHAYIHIVHMAYLYIHMEKSINDALIDSQQRLDGPYINSSMTEKRNERV